MAGVLEGRPLFRAAARAEVVRPGLHALGHGTPLGAHGPRQRRARQDAVGEAALRARGHAAPLWRIRPRANPCPSERTGNEGTAIRRTSWARALRVVRTQMTALRFSFDPIRSCVWVDARSSLLPIKTQTRGLRGWVDVALLADGTVDLDVPIQGRLEISVDR